MAPPAQVELVAFPKASAAGRLAISFLNAGGFDWALYVGELPPVWKEHPVSEITAVEPLPKAASKSESESGIPPLVHFIKPAHELKDTSPAITPDVFVPAVWGLQELEVRTLKGLYVARVLAAPVVGLTPNVIVFGSPSVKNTITFNEPGAVVRAANLAYPYENAAAAFVYPVQLRLDN